MVSKMKNIEENHGGYLFNDGQIVDFEILISNKIDFGRKTGALRIRITLNEVNVDFVAEKKPTKQQLNKIEELKIFGNRKLIFEIIDENNKTIKGYGGFDKTIYEMKQQIIDFYKQKRQDEIKIIS